jgi:homoserine kinase type II
MTLHDLFSPFDRERLGKKIDRLYGIGDVRSLELVHGGYMSRNYRVETDRGAYFLKQYRNRISTVIHEIKYAEQYFAEQGLPVIEPILERFSRPAFWFDENWYSLFPFVEGTSPSVGGITGSDATAMGSMLARFHQAGLRFDQRHFQSLALWDRRRFHLEYVELREALLAEPVLGSFAPLVLDTLERKRAFVESNRFQPRDLPLAYNCLLHGDFIPSNLFMDLGAVTRVFDLEKISIGPRAYELARSLLIACFDGGWDERNVPTARAFLRGYLDRDSMLLDEFVSGMRAYAVSMIHMTWMEARLVLYGDTAFLPLYERHAKRVEMLQNDPRMLCERLFQD